MPNRLPPDAGVTLYELARVVRPDYHAFFTYTMFSGTVPD
jgi:hypothetical protein